MSFHGRWQSGQLLSRIMNDLEHDSPIHVVRHGLPAAQRSADHRGDRDPAGDVLAAGCGRAGVDRADHLDRAALSARVHPAVAAGAGPVRPRGHPRRGVRARRLRVVKSFGREDYVYDRFDEQLTDLYDTQVSRVSVSAKFWTLLEVIPNLTLIVVLGFGAYAAGHGYVTMGTLVAFITMMLSLVWPIASLGFLLSMTQESFTAANRIAEIFDAPKEIADGPSADQPRRVVGSSSSTSASASRTPADDDWASAARRPHRRTRGDAGARRLDGIGQVGARRTAVAPLRRHRGRDPHRRPRHSRAVAGGAAADGRHRVRGPDAVLDVGRREPAAGPAATRRTSSSHRRSRSPPRSSSTTCRSAWTPGSANRA